MTTDQQQNIQQCVKCGSYDDLQLICKKCGPPLKKIEDKNKKKSPIEEENIECAGDFKTNQEDVSKNVEESDNKISKEIENSQNSNSEGINSENGALLEEFSDAGVELKQKEQEIVKEHRNEKIAKKIAHNFFKSFSKVNPVFQKMVDYRDSLNVLNKINIYVDSSKRQEINQKVKEEIDFFVFTLKAYRNQISEETNKNNIRIDSPYLKNISAQLSKLISRLLLLETKSKHLWTNFVSLEVLSHIKSYLKEKKKEFEAKLDELNKKTGMSDEERESERKKIDKRDNWNLLNLEYDNRGKRYTFEHFYRRSNTGKLLARCIFYDFIEDDDLIKVLYVNLFGAVNYVTDEENNNLKKRSDKMYRKWEAKVDVDNPNLEEEKLNAINFFKVYRREEIFLVYVTDEKWKIIINYGRRKTLEERISTFNEIINTIDWQKIKSKNIRKKWISEEGELLRL